MAPYAAKTASFLVSDMPSAHGTHGEHSGHGSGGNHVFESEIRTEPQIRQYIPPHSPALYDGEDDIDSHNDYAYQQASNDGKFTWVCRLLTGLAVTWLFSIAILILMCHTGYDCHDATY